MDKVANIAKVQNLHGKHRRICSGHKREGVGALLGEISMFAERLLLSRDGERRIEESAEVIVGARPALKD